MKIIGLIGGTTWISTLEYYRIINETVNEKLGGKHSASCILYSVDYEETIIKNYDNWNEIAKSFIYAAKTLEKAGAQLIIICANTIHKIADEVENSINIPFIHIADATGEKIKEKNLKKVGLLGTKYTMSEDFYKKRLNDKYGIETIIPSNQDQETIDYIICEELTFNIIKKSSKQNYIKIIKKLISNGAEGIILGCTEIPLLIKSSGIDIPMFDTTSIHAKKAVEYSLK
ncbi:MAG: aspartate/glutamate racemase family protein [Candidatus Thermoplasmatota archaeon]|nr:aspartate/glutamate racemase family protein [Candidatus Thermoplasmatota archaeon]